MQQVVVMEWGEPVVKNVIDINHQTREVQLQALGHYGSSWACFKQCMSQAEIDYYYISLAASEVNRLQIKQTIMESKSTPIVTP